MCTCDDETSQCVYRSEQEYRADSERQARASALEHEVLALLRGERAGTSPRAMEFATLLGRQPANGSGADVVDVLATDGDVMLWWSADGLQHQAALTERRAIRLAA